jgi:hypothetical protein
MHSPACHPLPSNTPRLQEEDYDALDIKYRTTTRKSTKATEEMARISEEETTNTSLKKIPGAISFILNTLLNSENVFDYHYLWSFDIDSPFIRIMQHITADYYQNCRSSVLNNSNDERAFFCEAVIPILKTFAIHMGNLTFKWYEKESEESESTRTHDEDYVLKNIDTKLLDGYGLSNNKKVCIAVESSVGQNYVVHSVEDSLNQIKNTTDFLTHLMQKYRNASATTFLKLKAPSMLVIHNQLTLSITSPIKERKMNAIVARTAVIPTTVEDRHEFVKLFELLAYLKEVWEEQVSVIEKLEMESTGLVDLESKMVKDYFSSEQ